MSSVARHSSGQWRQMAELEKGLLARVAQAQGELQRIEFLDEEQRAEIHAILEAIRHDGESHAQIVGTYISESGDA